MNNRVVAREWLVFVGCVGLTLVVMLTMARDDINAATWLLSLGLLSAVLYGAVQVCRMTWWSVRTIRRR
jgi:hypothetical protein